MRKSIGGLATLVLHTHDQEDPPNRSGEPSFIRKPQDHAKASARGRTALSEEGQPHHEGAPTAVFDREDVQSYHELEALPAGARERAAYGQPDDQ